MRALPILLLLAAACSTNNAPSDAGDASDDSGPDLCDLDLFFDAGGDKGPCLYASTRLCFHNMTDCPNEGCKCVATAMGPRWQCTTDLACKDAGDEAGEAGDDSGTSDSGSDSSADASDASDSSD